MAKQSLAEILAVVDSVRHELRPPPPRQMIMSTPSRLVHQPSATSVVAYPHEIYEWRHGRRMPSIIDNLARWWIATCVRHQIPVKVHDADELMLHRYDMMPIILEPRSIFFKTA